jgi:hypothetical protein
MDKLFEKRKEKIRWTYNVLVSFEKLNNCYDHEIDEYIKRYLEQYE